LVEIISQSSSYTNVNLIGDSQLFDKGTLCFASSAGQCKIYVHSKHIKLGI